MQIPALVHRKARGQTEWPGSQPGQQGTRVSLGCPLCKEQALRLMGLGVPTILPKFCMAEGKARSRH